MKTMLGGESAAEAGDRPESVREARRTERKKVSFFIGLTVSLSWDAEQSLFLACSREKGDRLVMDNGQRKMG